MAEAILDLPEKGRPQHTDMHLSQEMHKDASVLKWAPPHGV